MLYDLVGLWLGAMFALAGISLVLMVFRAVWPLVLVAGLAWIIFQAQQHLEAGHSARPSYEDVTR